MLSVAIMRRCGAHSGLYWADAMPSEAEHGRTRNRSRASKGAPKAVITDFACATIRRRPFRKRCPGLTPDIGKKRREIRQFEPIREPIKRNGASKGSINTTVSRETPSDSAMPDGIMIITD